MTAATMAARGRILVVEDDAAQRLALSDRLTREGFAVEVAADGDQAALAAATGEHDLVLLDVMLPGLDGFEVASYVRSRGVQTPILMLTARGGVPDKVVGLDVGADDYLAKPFEFVELLARIRALLRRAGKARDANVVESLKLGEVNVDFRRAEARRGDDTVQLSAKELELLRYLAENPDAVISRDELLDEVWGYGAMPTTRTVDVHVARLRRKLEVEPAAPRFLVTVRGLGYKLATTPAIDSTTAEGIPPKDNE